MNSFESAPYRVDRPDDVGPLSIEDVLGLDNNEIERLREEDMRDARVSGWKNMRGSIFVLEEGPDDMDRVDPSFVRRETARRINVFTSARDSEGFYSIDYSSVSEEYEMKIGLGEILVDPSIKRVEVKRKNSNEIIVGERKIGENGRVGFYDESGKYLPTFTGDKFRVLTEKDTGSERVSGSVEVERIGGQREDEMLDEDRQRIFDFRKELGKESSARERHAMFLENERERVSRLGRVSELIGLATDLVGGDLDYGRIAEYLRENEIDGFSEEERELAALECEDAAEAMREVPEFNLRAYKDAIAHIESRNDYMARNDARGRRDNVNPNRWAFGKYQFIAPTAARHGHEFDPQNEEQIQTFLQSPQIQERVMNNFTMANLRRYLPYRENFDRNGHDTYQVLAAMHIGGDGAVNFSEGTIRGGREDWLGTSIASYTEQISDDIRSSTSRGVSRGGSFLA